MNTITLTTKLPSRINQVVIVISNKSYYGDESADIISNKKSTTWSRVKTSLKSFFDFEAPSNFGWVYKD